MSKVYSNGGHTVTVADDGAIVVKPGDWLSKYSMAIHRDFNHVNEFGRKTPAPSGPVKPVQNVDQISAGETLYHLPTHREWARRRGGTTTPPAPRVSRANPVLILKSDRDPGKKRDGAIANDMLFGDYSKNRIINIRSMFEWDDIRNDLDTAPASVFFDKLELMATSLFAMGALEGNIKRMIARFKSNTGGQYSDVILTQAVKAHARCVKFENETRQRLHVAIKKYQGDVTQIIPNIDVQKTTGLFFNTKTDIANGLTIAINDVWAWRVEVVEYELLNNAYKGTYKITLYDHFGLYEPDVDNSKNYGYLNGFRSWFILQHLNRFAYRPFLTVASWESTFSGRL